jgi:hypothetical protein
MNLRLIAFVAAVLGGLLWVARWLTDGSAFSDGLYWAGLVAIAVALGVAGASLVRSSALPLRVLVAVAFPLLVWSVVSVFRPADPPLVDGLLGVVAVVVGGVGLARSRPPAPRRRAGSHAA